MASNEAKVKFTADTADFTKAIQAASRRVVELQSELRLNGTQMSSMGQSTDALTQRQKILAQQAQALADKKAALTEKLRLTEQYFGADSAEAVKLRVQLNNLGTQSVKLDGELAGVTAALDQQRAAETQTETASERLTNEIGRQEADLADLKRQYTDAVLEFGATSDEAQGLAGKITDLSGELSENKDKMEAAKAAAEQLGTEQEDTRNAFEKLQDTISDQEAELASLKKAYSNAVLEFGATSDEAQGLEKEVSSLSAELENNKHSMELAESAADSLDSTLSESAEGGWTELRQTVADLATNAIEKAADAVRDLASDTIEAAAAVKAESSQFAQTFGDLADQAGGAIERVADSSGILDTRLQTVGTSIYAFARTTGMESAEAMGLMERALTVTADSAAYYDRSLEDTAESLQSFLKGNYENDAALGLSCTETTRNAAANKLYGKSFSDLSESQKQLTLLQMVEDANALSGAMGQAARESDGWENVTGNLAEAQRQFLAVVG